MSAIRAEKPELKEMWANIMLLHIVGAGFDTLGTSLASFTSLVSRTPECQNRLVEEIHDSNLNRECKSEQLMQLPYLQACIRETMRLKPIIATSLTRTVPPQGHMLGDSHVPAGTIAGINPVVLHRTKEIFGNDANCFRPERWIEASKEQRDAIELCSLAFYSPRRICPRKNLAWLILCRTVVESFRQFAVRILEDEEVVRKALPPHREESFFVFKPYNIWAEFQTRVG